MRNTPSFKILACVVPAMIVPTLASLMYFVLFSGASSAGSVYAAAKIFLLAWPLIATWYLTGEGLSKSNSSLRRHLSAVPLGAMAGILIAAFIMGLYYWTSLGSAVASSAPEVRKKITDLGVAGYYIPFAAFLAVAHSLIEEYYWRWFVFGWLERVMRPAPAYALAGLAFAGHHYVVLGCYFPLWLAALLGTGVGIGGVIWCRLYKRQGTLAGAWVSHMLADVAILYIGYRLMQSP